MVSRRTGTVVPAGTARSHPGRSARGLCGTGRRRRPGRTPARSAPPIRASYGKPRSADVAARGDNPGGHVSRHRCRGEHGFPPGLSPALTAGRPDDCDRAVRVMHAVGGWPAQSRRTPDNPQPVMASSVAPVKRACRAAQRRAGPAAPRSGPCPRPPAVRASCPSSRLPRAGRAPPCWPRRARRRFWSWARGARVASRKCCSARSARPCCIMHPALSPSCTRADALRRSGGRLTLTAFGLGARVWLGLGLRRCGRRRRLGCGVPCRAW